MAKILWTLPLPGDRIVFKEMIMQGSIGFMAGTGFKIRQIACTVNQTEVELRLEHERILLAFYPKRYTEGVDFAIQEWVKEKQLWVAREFEGQPS